VNLTGLVTLSNNNQKRLARAFSFINIGMLPLYVSYVAKFPNVSVNLKKMIFDYEVIKDQIKDSKYYLMKDNQYSKQADLLDYTVNIIEYVRKSALFNTITYEVLPSNSALTWVSVRDKYSYHIPLITNSGCWTVYENNTFHLAADGTIYTVNKSNGHSFINAGPEPRVHLTLELLE
jgi:hypothetical protein